MRIAVITETWPPEVNGVAQTISRLVEGLGGRQHRIDLVRPLQPPDRAAAHGGPAGCPGAGVAGVDAELLVPGLPLPGYAQVRFGLPQARTLAARWRSWRPDVVHVVTEGPLGWSALGAARRLALPVVSDFRTNFHAYSAHYGAGWLAAPIRGYLRHFHNRGALTMVPTEALRRELAAQGFERLVVVARGVDTARFDPARRSAALRASWGVTPHGSVVLYVGRLAPEKNLPLLLEAFEAIRRGDPQARLVLVGDGPMAGRLREACPDAVFAGLRRGDDLARHYASADLFLFPSLTETFGNVVPEAMASGLAVVAFDCAAAGELIRSGHDGLLAPRGDPRRWLGEAARLAADRVRARRLGQQARRSALELGWDRIVACVEAQYERAIAAHARDSAAARVLPA